MRQQTIRMLIVAGLALLVVGAAMTAFRVVQLQPNATLAASPHATVQRP